jgi:hypothetical protein
MTPEAMSDPDYWSIITCFSEEDDAAETDLRGAQSSQKDFTRYSEAQHSMVDSQKRADIQTSNTFRQITLQYQTSSRLDDWLQQTYSESVWTERLVAITIREGDASCNAVRCRM